MSKIMSVFEKLNLVEKAVPEITTPEKINTSHNDYVHIQEELESKNIDGAKEEDEVEPQYFEPHSEDIKVSERAHIKQNGKFTIQEIYTSYGIENSDINTVFMLGNFINALPDSLPYEVRKKSVISIVASSNTDLMKLLGDGEKRLDVLNKFSSDYYNATVYAVEAYKNKIAELRNQINSYEEQIRVNETLLKEQNNIIKYETDKIESIINFINNGN